MKKRLLYSIPVVVIIALIIVFISKQDPIDERGQAIRINPIDSTVTTLGNLTVLNSVHANGLIDTETGYCIEQIPGISDTVNLPLIGGGNTQFIFKCGILIQINSN